MGDSDSNASDLLAALHNHIEGMDAAGDEADRSRRATLSVEELVAASKVAEQWPLQITRIQFFARSDPSRIAPLLIELGENFFPHTEAMCAIDERLPAREVNVWGRVQSSAHRLVRDLAIDFCHDIWNACDEGGFAKMLMGEAPSSGPANWSPNLMHNAILMMHVMDDTTTTQLRTLIRMEREELEPSKPFDPPKRSRGRRPKKQIIPKDRYGDYMSRREQLLEAKHDNWREELWKEFQIPIADFETIDERVTRRHRRRNQ